MKTLISSSVILIMLTQSAFGWNAQDMSNSIMGSIHSASKSSSVKTNVLPGSDIALAVFTLCMIFCPGAAAGAGKGLHELGKKWVKATDKLNEHFDENPIEWIKIYSPDQIKNMQSGQRAKSKIKVAKAELSPIQLAVFRELGSKELKQVYGVVRVSGKEGNSHYTQTSDFSKITAQLSVAGKALSGMNVQGIMKNVKVGGFGI